MPRLGAHTEIIFIEGNSTDHTWAEIERVRTQVSRSRYQDDAPDRERQGQRGPRSFCSGERGGPDDPRRRSHHAARGTGKFYDALISGRADFANGVRLVYPMEDKAMRFCNLCANKFFGLAFSWALGQPIKDTLCGTKVLFKTDYERIAANRAHFGDFDPFGDFDLLFGANHLHLKIGDIPIRYRDRTYGETNIQRWRHGVLLLKMLLLAITKIKLI